MFTAIRCFISNFLKMFSPAPQTDAQQRLMAVEQDVHHIKGVLDTDSVRLFTSKHEEHFDLIVSKSVMKWLANWADEKYASQEDIETAVSDAISDHDFTDVVDDCLNSRDWDYELRDAVDWDRVADKVAEKLDWETIISDNDIVTNNDIDLDDVMLKSDHLSEDDIVTRDELSDMVIGELKRDWFEQKMKDEVTRHFKDTLQSVRQTEEDNCRNAIDDAIEAKLDLLLTEQMRSKFGPQFDIWFHNLVAHAVKTVMGEMVKAAYEEVVSNEDNSNA